ncbi:MAG: polysaccharide deacetylase family protein [Pelomonas sp.]|nr:polysaccharide deacetylase family protein [Roseateles sp.]
MPLPRPARLSPIDTRTGAIGVAAAALLSLAATVASAAPACGPDALGTARVITLPREAAAWGAPQHQALPMLSPKEVVVTFDDGPHPGSTPSILATLASQCVKATFFEVGAEVEAHPEIARAVRDAGYAIGGHGYHHEHFPQLSPEAQLADLGKLKAALKTELGIELVAYRFPFLEETQTLKDALAAQRTTIMSIDVAIDDWLPDQTAEMLAARLLERLKASPGHGHILLFHDAFDGTAKALPLLLETLRKGGYSVVQLRWE